MQISVLYIYMQSKCRFQMKSFNCFYIVVCNSLFLVAENHRLCFKSYFVFLIPNTFCYELKIASLNPLIFLLNLIFGSH